MARAQGEQWERRSDRNKGPGYRSPGEEFRPTEPYTFHVIQVKIPLGFFMEFDKLFL